MRISENLTIRGGKAFAIMSYSEDGPSLLRRIAMPERVIVPAPIYRNAVDIPTPTVVPTTAPQEEPVTIRYARREDVSISTRVGSCAKRGLRKNAQVRHGFSTNREIKALTNNQKGRNRATRLGNEGGWVGKTASWKDSRETQYR